MTPGPSASATGYVLAGGRSSRMGQDKALLASNGPNLLQRALDALRGACAEAYILSGPRNDDRDALLSCYAHLVSDPTPDHAGPVAGLLAALQHCPTPYACIIAVDQPGIDTKHLQTLLTAATQGRAFAACFQQADGQLEPLPIVLSCHLRKPVEEQWHNGERRLLTTVQAATRQAASLRPGDPAGSGGLLRVPLLSPVPMGQSPLANLNSPSDLQTWQSAAAASNQSHRGASE